jgi:hypothetical protein
MLTDSGGEMRWSADPPPGRVAADGDTLDERHVAGTLIRFLCDYGVEMPLWTRTAHCRTTATVCRRVEPDWRGRRARQRPSVVNDARALPAHVH